MLAYAPIGVNYLQKEKPYATISTQKEVDHDADLGIGSKRYISEYLRLIKAEGYGADVDYLMDLLCKLRVREAVPVLLKLHGNDPHAWHWTLLKYGPMTGDAALIPVIRPYLESDDGEFRSLARKALKRLED